MKRAFIVVVAGLFLYGGWRWLADDELADGGEDPALILRYIWSDKDPERMRPTDFAHLFALVEDDRGRPVGGVLKASHHDFHLRLFDYRVDGRRVKVRFRQDGNSSDFKFRITHCAQGHCLELNKSPWGGPKRYFAIAEIERRSGLQVLEDWARGLSKN